MLADISNCIKESLASESLVSIWLRFLLCSSGRRLDWGCFASPDLGVDVQQHHDADVDQTHDEHRFRLHLEPCAIFREVFQLSALLRHLINIIGHVLQITISFYRNKTANISDSFRKICMPDRDRYNLKIVLAMRRLSTNFDGIVSYSLGKEQSH